MTVLLASELTAADLALLARPEPARPSTARAPAAAPWTPRPEAAGRTAGPVQNARHAGQFARPAGRSASPLAPIRWFAIPAN